MRCSGFVQVLLTLTYGCPLEPVSVSNGEQWEIKKDIDRNCRNKQWVLIVNNEYIGYWPPHLFTNLQHGADTIIWGGEIINDWKDNKHTITEMGSGHFPTQGFGQAAFFWQVMIKYDYHI